MSNNLEQLKSHNNKTNDIRSSNGCGFIISIAVMLLWLIILMYVIPLTPSKEKSHKYAFNEFVQTSGKPSNKIHIPISPLKMAKLHGKSIETKIFVNEKYMERANELNDEKGYKDTCPVKFPTKAVTLDKLPNICSYLPKFKILGNCNIDNCSKCVPPKSETMPWANDDTVPWLTAFDETKELRYKELKDILKDVDDGPIVVMAVNHGFSILYLNWLCSLKINNILDSDIKRRVIIITTDKETAKRVDNTGFISYFPSWLGKKNLRRLDKNAAVQFGLGGHRFIVALQIAMIHDLIHLGYDVIMQDIDIIWKKNPINYLYINEYKYIDIQMSNDGRMDKKGPGNSGFFMIRSNCKTRIFMDTIISLIGLVFVGRSDQMLWNILIDERVFRMINFEVLNSDLYINGNRASKDKYIAELNLDDIILFHSSWTMDIFDKIDKFNKLDTWYFTKDKCNAYFDDTILPDLKTRKWFVRNKTQEQEIRLKKLGYVIDTSNGVFGPNIK